MAYCTYEDLKEAVPEDIIVQLTDDENYGAVNMTRVENSIILADAEIDSYCAMRYTVPLSPVSDTVRMCSIDIAIYNLYSRKMEEVPKTRSDRYHNAIRKLEGIAKGTITIGAAQAVPQAPGGGAQCDKRSDDRIITMQKLEGY